MRRNSQNDGCAHDLDDGDDFSSVHVCPNGSSRSL